MYSSPDGEIVTASCRFSWYGSGAKVVIRATRNGPAPASGGSATAASGSMLRAPLLMICPRR
jgi:hypothetical protein